MRRLSAARAWCPSVSKESADSHRSHMPGRRLGFVEREAHIDYGASAKPARDTDPAVSAELEPGS